MEDESHEGRGGRGVYSHYAFFHAATVRPKEIEMHKSELKANSNVLQTRLTCAAMMMKMIYVAYMLIIFMMTMVLPLYVDV